MKYLIKLLYIESPKKCEKQNFHIEGKTIFAFYYDFSVLKYSVDITIVNMLNCFLSFPNSFTIITLKPRSPIQEKLVSMPIASWTLC